MYFTWHDIVGGAVKSDYYKVMKLVEMLPLSEKVAGLKLDTSCVFFFLAFHLILQAFVSNSKGPSLRAMLGAFTKPKNYIFLPCLHFQKFLPAL